MSIDLLRQPFNVRGLTLPNRVVIPPMCIWAAEADSGLANDEHFVHYTSMAESGPGLIIVEATGVQPCGIVSPNDLALYKDSQIAPLKRICDYIHTHTPSKIAVQLGHGGRKSIQDEPMGANPKHLGPGDPHGVQCVSASAIPHAPHMLTPKALTLEEIEQLKKDWISAAQRAVEAGFDAIEIHAAHGCLLNQFSSPVSNHRVDIYGGSFENRIRLPLEIAEGIRQAIPQSMPLIYRLSCVDWVDDGVTIEDSALYAKELHKKGVDLIHCSSAGISYKQQIDPKKEYDKHLLGYQIEFSEKIKQLAGVQTIAVGGIRSYEQAQEVVDTGKGDLVAVGRAYLADPQWWRSVLRARHIDVWHPPRQMMGFQKSQRRLETEKKSAAAVESQETEVAA